MASACHTRRCCGWNRSSRPSCTPSSSGSWREARGAWPAWPVALSASLLALFAFVVRTGHRLREEGTGESRRDEPVRRASEYVHGHLGDRLSAAGVARAIGYHPSYLSRVFRHETGVRLVEYIMRARVEYAARLLVADEGDDQPNRGGRRRRETVQSVAARAGFASAHYFSRIFRQFKGCSPGAFRRRRRRPGLALSRGRVVTNVQESHTRPLAGAHRLSYGTRAGVRRARVPVCRRVKAGGTRRRSHPGA